jgi:hypothetical protein
MAAALLLSFSKSPLAQERERGNSSLETANLVPPSAPPGAAGPSANPQMHRRPVVAGGGSSDWFALTPSATGRKRLTANDKFDIYAHRTFDPQKLMRPAADAGFTLIDPPSRFPHEWKAGGGAFGRWYGREIVTSTASRTGALLAQIGCHEDRRYVPSASTSPLLRTVHAIGFAFVDRSDSGHYTIAFSNFAGAAAGGFVGMAFLPNGQNDATHAEQRALRTLASNAAGNVITEFQPQWAPLLRKIIPKIVPEWAMQRAQNLPGGFIR